MTPERLAGAAPALVMLAAGIVVAVLCFAEARRIDRNAARGHRTPVRPHSAHTGTATGDHKAIAHHDKEQQMTTHPYTRSPHSNAGNCECGMAEESTSHPHTYTQAYRSNGCVCGRPADHPVHTDAATPNPVYPEPQPTGLHGTEAGREAVRQARGDEAVPQKPVLFAVTPTGDPR